MKKRAPKYAANVPAQDERWQEDKKAARKAEQLERDLQTLRELWNFPINTMAAWAIEMAADKNGRLLVRDARDAEPGKKAKIDHDAALMFEDLARAATKVARVFIDNPHLIWERTEF